MSEDFRNIDSDWKARAEAEREELKKKIDAKGDAAGLPPANFMVIISSYATQAMVALGEAEMPGSTGRSVDLPAARFMIDCLGVLKEKTQGNLNEAEQKSLDDVLQTLRLRFVQKAKEEEKAGKPDILGT
jgi:hypothetical protein